MWIFIWIVLSAILIGASLWSLRILINQKTAWEKFAREKKFTFNKGTFMGPAEMNGIIGDYKISFFTAERQTVDVRSKRFVTVLEVDLMDGLVDGGVFGTQEMLPFMQTLDRLHPYKIDHDFWVSGLYAFVRDDAPVAAYLTPERAETVSQILKTKNADTVIIFNDKEIVVRMETIDPMQDAEKIDKIIKRLLALIDQIRITPQQRAQYAAAQPVVAVRIAPAPIAVPATAETAPQPVADAPLPKATDL